ncbi:diguanylate cyclase [Guyparkeria halopsychrophila]|uniref:GGDEF domain-containing protein n=1 Tax=Guyparkeria halopsychrophila TaxID=3139421 RepID=UPI0037C5776C
MSQHPSSKPSAHWLADIDSLDREGLTERLRSMAAELDLAHDRERALIDDLTGLGNRRDFVRQLDTLFSQHQRNDLPVSLILLDIVQFINHHGPSAGDRVLRAFGDCLRETLRGMDMSFRIADHEFAVILPDTSVNGTSAVADKLRLAAAYFLVEDASASTTFDVSVGVAAFRVEDQNADAVVQRAYEALDESRAAQADWGGPAVRLITKRKGF